MKNPKVGERVVIYGHDQSMDYRVIKGWIAKLPDETDREGLLTIRTDAPPSSGFGGTFRYAHPKQCRRLKKKWRLTLWVNREELHQAQRQDDFALMAYIKKPELKEGETPFDFMVKYATLTEAKGKPVKIK